jgi:hypothetical protein
VSKPIHGTNSKAPPPSIGARRAAATIADTDAPTECAECAAPLRGAYLEAAGGRAICCAECPDCECNS